MKLGLLGPAPPLRGGIVTYLAMLARVLGKRGHEIYWSSFRKQYPRWLFPGGEQEGKSASWLQHTNVPRFVPWSPWSWWRTYRDLDAAGVQAVVIKYWLPFFAPGYTAVAWLLQRFTSVAVIYILDNVIPHEKYPFGRLLTRMALRQGDGYIAQSQQVMRDLFEVLPGLDPAKVVTTPHPVYELDPPGAQRRSRAEARQVLGLPPEGKLLLFFGFIKPYKGVVHLIDAVPRLRDHYGADLQVLIVGDIYGERQPYRERIEASGAAASIRLVDDFVPDDAVADYFLAADLVVLPYVSATQSGIVQIAYNYDRPVVTTQVGGLPEVVIDGVTGFVVPPEDPEALAQAVIRFFDEERAAEFEAAVVVEKAKYSWESMAAAVETLSGGDRKVEI